MPLDPSTALPDPQNYMFHGPFGVSYQTPLGFQAGANRQQTVAPFLQQSLQSGEADLQQKLLENREYAGESASAEREAGRRAKTAGSLQEALSAPVRGQLERDTASGKIAALQYQNPADLEIAKQALTAAKGKPAFNAMAMAGGAMEDMDNTKSDDEARQIHENLQQAYQQKYPGEPLTGPLAKPYGPHTKGEYHIAYSAMTHTPEIFAETAKQTQAGQQARLTAKAPHYEERVADAELKSRERIAQATLEAGKNATMRLGVINRQLANPSTPAAQLQALQDEKATLTPEVVNAELDRMHKPLSAGDYLIPGVADAYSKSRQADRDSLLAQHAQKTIESLADRGIAPSMSQLRQVAPGRSDAQIKAIWNKHHPDLPIK